MTRNRKLLRILLRVFGGLLALALAVLACLSLILSKPRGEEEPPLPDQPLLSASPAVTVSEEAGLRQLLDSFPAPVMSFMSGSGMVFVSGVSADTALSGGFGRIVTLYWQTSGGEPVTLQSIYPASAYSLLRGGDYHFSNTEGPALFGQTSVRMENADTVRLHTAAESGLYTVTVPRSLSGGLSALTRSLQLFAAAAEP